MDTERKRELKDKNRKLELKEGLVINYARKFLGKQVPLSTLKKAYAEYEIEKEKARFK
jgi:hypothetical protein